MADLDDELRDAGAHWRARQAEPRVDLGRVSAGSRSRGVFIAAGASIVGVAAIVFVAVLADRPTTRPHVTVRPTTTPSTMAPPRPEVIELNSAIVQPDVLAVDGTRLWVAGYAGVNGKANGEPAHLQHIDSETGKLLGDVLLPDDSPFGIRVADGAVWVAAQQREDSTELLKIDAASMRIVERIPRQVSSGFDVAAGTVWSTDGGGALDRIDPTSGRGVATIPVHKFAIYAAGWVVAGPLGVFVGNGYDGVVQRIDESTNTAGPEIHVAADMADMVELDGSLWVGRSDGSQVIEVRNGSKARAIDLGERAYTLATDGKALWLGTASARVLRVDPTTGVVARVSLPAGTRASTVAADPSTGAVWATSMTPSPRLLRVPTAPPTTPSTTVRPRCAGSDDCPPPPPIPCPDNQTVPSFANTFCGPVPGPGNGRGPSGECTGSETAPPCGPGMLPGRYYEYTLPGRCDGKLVLDGRHWLSTLPPPTNGPDMNVWVSVSADGSRAGFISPNGAVEFEPDTGQPATGRSGSCR